jgi:hypothetical protein
MRNKKVEKIFEEALVLINSKNEDYASPIDFYANFRMVEYAGLPTWVGVHVRMLDKISRLNGFVRRFIETGNISSTVDESIEDTLLDAINYSAITLDTYRQYIEERNHELNRNATTDNSDETGSNSCPIKRPENRQPEVWARYNEEHVNNTTEGC